MTSTQNLKPKTPGYRVIAGEMLALIRSGKVGPGERLPTMSQLEETYGVTRPTVRKAYGVLIENGYVVAHGRVGYFVRVVKRRRWTLAREGRYVDPWQQVQATHGPAARQSITVELVAPQLDVAGRALADWFDYDPDEVVCRNALRTVDNEPVALTSTYLPLRVADGTRLRRPEPLEVGEPDLMEVDASTFLARVCGERMGGFADTASSRVATDRELRLLELPEASTVTEVVRRVRFAPGGRVLVVEHAVFEAAGAEFEHDVTLEAHG